MLIDIPNSQEIAVGPYPSRYIRSISRRSKLSIIAVSSLSIIFIAGPAAEFPVSVAIAAEGPTAVFADERVVQKMWNSTITAGEGKVSDMFRGLLSESIENG